MTDQKQAEYREAFEAWIVRTPYGRYSTARRGDSKYDSSHTQLMWETWQARGEYEAQHRPDLRVVREALEEADQVLARYWFYRNEEDEDNNDDVIACNKNVKKALAALPALALLTTPQAAPATGEVGEITDNEMKLVERYRELFKKGDVVIMNESELYRSFRVCSVSGV